MQNSAAIVNCHAAAASFYRAKEPLALPTKITVCAFEKNRLVLFLPTAIEGVAYMLQTAEAGDPIHGRLSLAAVICIVCMMEIPGLINFAL